MERKQEATVLFLLVLAAIALYFCFLIIRPFLSPIFLAVVLAIVFYPVHTRIQARIRKPSAAAVLSTVLVILAFVAPVIGLGIVISRETSALYKLLDERSTEQGGWNPYVMHAIERVVQWAGHYVDLSNLNLRGTALRWLQQVSRYLFSTENINPIVWTAFPGTIHTPLSRRSDRRPSRPTSLPKTDSATFTRNARKVSLVLL
jgi:predicted PurR-regulated permease PerM